MCRIVWIALLLGGIGLSSGCGDDGTTATGGDALTGSFACNFTRGEALGVSECREGYEIHAYHLTLDWWTDMAARVDSVIFRIPSHSAIWTESSECLSDGFEYRQEKGTRDGDHWRLDHAAYGYLSHHPLTNLWLSLEFAADSLAKADVYSVDGKVTAFTTQPMLE